MNDSEDNEKHEGMKKMGLTDKEKAYRRAKSTDSQEEDGGEALPTAALVQLKGVNHDKVPTSTEYLIDICREGDELVRRSDVKALIQDKIDSLKEEHEIAEDTQLPIIKWRIKALQSLLEELEQ